MKPNWRTDLANVPTRMTVHGGILLQLMAYGMSRASAYRWLAALKLAHDERAARGKVA